MTMMEISLFLKRHSQTVIRMGYQSHSEPAYQPTLATLAKNQEMPISATSVVYVLFLSTMIIFNIAGNSLVCSLMLKKRAFKTSINWLLFHLAIADLLVAVFFIPPCILSHFIVHPSGSLLILIKGKIAGINYLRNLFKIQIYLGQCGCHFKKFDVYITCFFTIDSYRCFDVFIRDNEC